MVRFREGSPTEYEAIKIIRVTCHALGHRRYCSTARNDLIKLHHDVLATMAFPTAFICGSCPRPELLNAIEECSVAEQNRFTGIPIARIRNPSHRFWKFTTEKAHIEVQDGFDKMLTRQYLAG